jgi:hypothetical protein
MYRLKALAIASGLGSLMLAMPAMADEWNKKTILTVNEPIQVPGKVLPPGKYVMKLMDSPSNRHIVQIFNGDETQLQTTVLAIPNYRLQPTGHTAFGWWETPAGQPKALRSWFYPGDNFGQEFAYPKNEATQIAAYSKTQVPVTYAEKESELATARVGTVNEAGAEAPMPAQTAPQAQATTPQQQTEVAQSTMPQATPQPEAQPAPAQTMPAQTLPRTASPFPVFGLLGLLSVGAGSLLRAVRRG